MSTSEGCWKAFFGNLQQVRAALHGHSGEVRGRRPYNVELTPSPA